MCSLKVDLLSVTFDPEAAEFRSVILTHHISGHYVATLIVATRLVIIIFLFFLNFIIIIIIISIIITALTVVLY